MEVACPERLEKMMGKARPPDSNKSDETSASGENPQSSRRTPRWSTIDDIKLSIVDDNKFVDNDEFVDNGISTSMNGTDHSREINELYGKLHELEDKFVQQDKPCQKVELSGIINQAGTTHDDSVYQVQNEHRTQLTSLEKKIEDLRLALQMHKSSSKLMSESIQHLYGRVSFKDEEFS